MGQLAPDVRALEAEPIAIAVTGTFSQMAFAASLGVDYPLLSDWDGVVADLYGAQYIEWLGHSGVAKRSVFVIDSSGFIRYRWQTEDALVLPPLDEAVAALQAL